MPRALIVDDDEGVLRTLAEASEKVGFATTTATTLAEARVEAERFVPDLFVLDIVLPDGSGLDLLMEIPAGRTVLLMSQVDEVRSALADLPLNDIRFIEKPVDLEKLVESLRGLRRELSKGPAPRDEVQLSASEIVGSSEGILAVLRQIDLVAPSDETVLIFGESGTGKDLVAREIHRRSRPGNEPYVAINCGALTESLVDSELFGHEKGAFTGAKSDRGGLISEAENGTLFLDEITEMAMNLQVRLLRVLETRRLRRVGGDRDIEVNVRVIASTNRDPVEAVRTGVLREDLYYRLAVFPIHVPPLRERRGDIKLLGEHFLAELNRETGKEKQLAPEFLERMKSYPWPGNVRQLKHLIRRAHLLSRDDVIDGDLPIGRVISEPTASPDQVTVRAGTPLEDVEKELILKTLRLNAGNKVRTAQALGISVRTLYNRLKRWEDSPDAVSEETS